MPAFFLPLSQRREQAKEEAAKRLKEEAERRKQDARTFFRAGQSPTVSATAPTATTSFFTPREASRGPEAARAASDGFARRVVRVQAWPQQQHVGAPAALAGRGYVAPWPRLPAPRALGSPQPEGGSPRLSSARGVVAATPTPHVVDLTSACIDSPSVGWSRGATIDLCSPGPGEALAVDEGGVVGEMVAAAGGSEAGDEGEAGAAWRSLLHTHLHRVRGGTAGPGPDAAATQPISAAWPALHCPRSASDAVGQTRAARLLAAWLRAWCECREGPDAAPAPPQKRRRSRGDDEYTLSDEEEEEEPGQWGGRGEDVSDEEDDCGAPGVLSAAFVLLGPPGVGKTSLVYACAADVGAQVLEVNASARRTRESVRRQFGEATQSRRVRGGGSGASAADAASAMFRGSSAALGKGGGGKAAASKRASKRGRVRTPESPPTPTGGTGPGAGVTVLLFDEAELDFREDVGWAGAVRALLTEARTPIVLTCNELPPFLRDTGVPVCCMPRPVPAQCAPSLVAVAAAHGARLTGAHALALARHCGGDMRRALLTLQLWLGARGRGDSDADAQSGAWVAAVSPSPGWSPADGSTRLALTAGSSAAEVAKVDEGEDALPLGAHRRALCIDLAGPAPSGALRATVAGAPCAVQHSADSSLLTLRPPALDALPREAVCAWTRRAVGEEGCPSPAVSASSEGRPDSDSDFQSPFRLRAKDEGEGAGAEEEAGAGEGGEGAEAAVDDAAAADAEPQGDPAIEEEEEEGEGGGGADTGPLVRCLRKKGPVAPRSGRPRGSSASRPVFIAEDEPASRVVLPMTVEEAAGGPGERRRWQGYLVYMTGGDAGAETGPGRDTGPGNGEATGAGTASSGSAAASCTTAPPPPSCAAMDAAANEAELLSACATLWQGGAAPASPGREVESYCTLVGSEAELPAASVLAWTRSACGSGAEGRGSTPTSRPGSSLSGSASRSGAASSRSRSGFGDAASRGAGAAALEAESLAGAGRDRFAAALAAAAPLWASGTVEPDFGDGGDVQRAAARDQLRRTAEHLCERAASHSGADAKDGTEWVQGVSVEGGAAPLEELHRAVCALRRAR